MSSSSTATKEIASEGHSAEALAMNTSNANGSSTLVMGASSIGSISETTSVPYLTHSMSLQQHSWKMQPPRLRFVSSVEFRHSSGETSTTPLSPESPVEYSSGETTRPSRLQRSKASGRKTFRSRRGRLTTSTTITTATATMTIAGEGSAQSSDQSETPKPLIAGDLSWDSVSQTSSTSGYRDNNTSLQTGLLSPDSSFACTGTMPTTSHQSTAHSQHSHLHSHTSTQFIPRSSSQHSLLMLFEAQDEEDTLI